MKTAFRLAACGFACLSLCASAADLEWRLTRTNATQRALDSGRLILLMAGRSTCGNCQYMKETVCESPFARAVIDPNYVCWSCDIDGSTEWLSYAEGLSSFTLPLICVIDPGNPTAYLDRSTGIQYEGEFMARLTSHLPDSQPQISAAQAAADAFELCFPAATNCSYRVLRAERLPGPWTPSGSIVTGSGFVVTHQVSVVSSQQFFRIVGFR